MCLRRSVGLFQFVSLEMKWIHTYIHVCMYKVDIWLGVVKIELKSPFYQVFERGKGQKRKGGNKIKKRMKKVEERRGEGGKEEEEKNK